MREFNSAASFAAFFTEVLATLPVAQHIGLATAAKIIQTEAKREIGEYQDEVGPFEAWQELADFTKQDRVSKGFPENEPLLRTGELRDSIQSNSSATEANIGSDSEIAVWQELGTVKIPPRSFLGGAAARKGHEGVAALAGTVVAHIIGTAQAHFPNDED